MKYFGKHFGGTIKFIIVGFFALIVVAALSPFGKVGAPKKANADSLDVYPGVCLGGWQNPSNAAGQPDVPPGGDSFSVQNSAVLDQADAQILCGSFQGSDQSQTPSAVTLHFSWNVTFASEAPSSGSSSIDTDSADWSSVLDTTSTDTSTPVVAPSSTPTSTGNSDSNDQNATTTNTGASTPPTPTSTPAPAPTPTPAPVATPSSTPDQSTSDGSSTSLLQNIFGAPLGFLVQRSFADSTGTASTTPETSTTDASDSSTALDFSSGDNFIDVSYSLDGSTWVDLGPVSESDWQNYSVTIPVSSWSDINNLQVQLSPMITPDPPTIYLDGMWLEVDYNSSILGDIENAIAGILPTDTLPTSTTPASPQDATTDNPSPAAQPAPPAPPAAPEHQYVFSLQSAQAIKVGHLGWAPEGNASGSASGTTSGSSAPTVSVPATNTIQIAGPCTSAYYTILIFPDADDYETNPSLALYNEANTCVGGSFSQTIDDLDLPSQLASGTYYLVVANQGTKGPWVPDPEIYPITLDLSDVSTTASSSQ